MYSYDTITEWRTKTGDLITKTNPECSDGVTVWSSGYHMVSPCGQVVSTSD